MMQESPDAANLDLNWIQRVEKLAEAVALPEGCILYDLEFVPGRILRVFIDKVPGGAGIAECSKISHGLEALLDADDIVPGGKYDLEVSTPGIERHLKKAWHFEKVVGEKIWVKTEKAVADYGIKIPALLKAKQFQAILVQSEQDQLVLNLEGEVFSVPFSEIEKAHVVFEMEKDIKKKPRQ